MFSKYCDFVLIAVQISDKSVHTNKNEIFYRQLKNKYLGLSMKI